ncbi:MAG TPA: aminoglycoside phosphotransferase family protein [Acidimicrobiales bacterium]|nr:aminoglycoside phosphotransferase family protein [Acidimicrobiales bacterium]
MIASELPGAVAACRTVATTCGLRVDEAVVLQNSNRLAVHLRPCDVLARVAPRTRQAGAAFEIEVTRRLAGTDAPLATLDPRVEPLVYSHDDFAVTLWTYYEPASPRDIAPADYASALMRLHAGIRQADPPGDWPGHFMDRVDEALRLVEESTDNHEIADSDRELLGTTLRTLSRNIMSRGASEQMLHGEPHPGNVLRTNGGLLFIDLESCCRGPVEFDIAHAGTNASGPPIEVARNYRGADVSLVRECWTLMLAMATAWRLEPGDDLPSGHTLAMDWIRQLRTELDP